MCNIAGYVGTRAATPILLDMIRKQEGLNGGFYTGLAVHDGQKLNYAKLRGDLDTLCSAYDMAAFPGSAGIIHSRTPSGGGDLWAHPFTAPSLDDPRLCYVANGSYGIYKPQRERYDRVADRFVADGFDIPCKTEEYSPKYNHLSDGSSIHLSDLVCQMIYRIKQTGIPTQVAMAQAICQVPHELVGLVMEEECADRIYFCRINAPMFVGFDESGAYLASSPTALPSHIQSFRLLPALSCGIVYRDRVEISKFTGFPHPVRGFNRRTVEKVKATLLQLFAQEEAGFPQMRKAVDAILPTHIPTQRAALIYLALYDLLRTHQITSRPGNRTVDGQTAPLTLFRITKGKRHGEAVTEV